jgi:type II secretory pathway pseudopilin PulG
MNMMRFSNQRGFGLIELSILLIVFAIGASIALQSMSSVMKSARTVETEREMEIIADGIVGDPEITNDGMRASFGFVGDCGVFPTSVDALRTNSDNIPTWNGPYVNIAYTQDSTSWRTDGWGTAYSYAAGTSISSTGSGSTITKKIVDATTDYTRNTITGSITDNVGTAPGTTYDDSVRIIISVPTGTGGVITKSYTPSSAGNFTLDSIPAGKRLIRAVMLSRNDTIKQLLTVLPRHKSTNELIMKFGSSCFTTVGGGGGSSTMTLRPNGNGSNTALSRSGTATNWDAVNDASTDDNTTYVYKSSTAASDSYALEDPPTTTGNINKITIHYRVKTGAGTNANAMPRLYVSSNWHNGTKISTSASWMTNTYEWQFNPATGAVWSWTDITNLQPGIQLEGNSGSHAAWCTQLYVVVDYQ